MPEFDPERFENKYEQYFTELQRAYRDAFETMNDTYDSELVHAIDQQILDESEPFFEDGEFRVELPDNPADRVSGVIDEQRLQETLEAYVDQLETELHHVFGIDRE